LAISQGRQGNGATCPTCEDAVMDCAAWHQDTKYPYVVRIRGCEFSMTGAELSELVSHLVAVRDGAAESLSEDYKDCRIQRRNEGKGIDLVNKLGIVRKPKVLIERRL